MSARLWVGGLSLVVCAFFGGAPEPLTSATHAAAQNVQEATTTVDDQIELGVTVYNSDIALVRDVRNLQLARGTSHVRASFRQKRYAS